MYPFRFRAPAGVFERFLISASFPYDLSDCVSNVLLYLPLGFFAALSLGRRPPHWARITAGTFFGAALSLAVELIQTFDATRASSVWDFSSNTVGALLGAVAGACASVAAVFPAVMVMCWVGFRAMSPFLSPAIATEDRVLKVFHFSLAWLSLCLLLEPIAPARLRRWAPALVLALTLGLQFWFSNAIPLAETAGGVLALLLWSLFLWKSDGRARAAALAIVLYVALDALRPYHFLAVPRHFGWIPFLSIIHDFRTSLVSATLAKVFMYGAMLWTLARAGWPVRRAVFGGTVFVLLLRLIQVYLPGRTAEITDAVMTLLLGACLALMNPPPRSSLAGSNHETITNAPHGQQMAGTRRVGL